MAASGKPRRGTVPPRHGAAAERGRPRERSRRALAVGAVAGVALGLANWFLVVPLVLGGQEAGEVSAPGVAAPATAAADGAGQDVAAGAGTVPAPAAPEPAVAPEPAGSPVPAGAAAEPGSDPGPERPSHAPRDPFRPLSQH